MQPRFDSERPFIGRPLRNLWSRFEADLLVGIRAAYGDDMTATSNRLMLLLDLEGTRIGELARRAGVTKQSMAESVALLEARGFVRRETDPDDARAKLVVLTASGRKALAIGRQVAESIHDRWEAVLGERDMQRLLVLLAKLDAGLRDPEKGP